MADTAPSHIFKYDFIAPDAGTYWFHPHSGTQLDRGLYAPLIIDDPNEIVNYNAEWIVILDDWTDGLGENPDQILAGLIKSGGGQPSQSGGAHNMHDMGSMDGAQSMDGMTGVDSGDVTYPKMLINGRPLNDPEIFHAKPGDKIRLRIINAAADTIFHVALDQHSMSVTHSDGFPVTPLQTSLLQIGMGERYDLIVTMKDGVFPLVASAEGKNQEARAFIRTGAGALPPTSYKIAALSGKPLTAFSLEAVNSVRLPAKKPDRIQHLVLTGGMAPYLWKINGKSYS